MAANRRLSQILMSSLQHGRAHQGHKIKSKPRLLCTHSALEEKERVKLCYTIHQGSHPDTPIVFLHGLLSSGRNFDGIAKQLVRNTGRTIVTFDARNHGSSDHADEMGFEAMASDVVNLLQEIKAKSCIPIGHSLGGRTAMTLALSRPELVEKLVLIDISPIHHSRNLEVLHILQGMMAFEPSEGMSLSENRQYAGVELETAIPDKSVRDFILTNLVELDGRVQWRVNLDVMMKSFRELGRIPMGYPPYTGGQALFIAGGLSDYIKEEDLPDIAKFFPRSEVKTIEGSDHWVHYHKPKELIEMLTEFLNG